MASVCVLTGQSFQGAYGSDREGKLEEEMDDVSDRKAHIQVAHAKWSGARLLTAYAQAQLREAVQKWDQIAANAAG